MFHSRPLTWLFFIATASVNLALVWPMLQAPVAGIDTIPRALFFYCIPAQIAMVAVWAAIGRSHRLARAALLALALFVAALLAQRLSPDSWPVLLALHMLQALLVWGGTLTLRLAGWFSTWPTMELPSRADCQQQPAEWLQFSLVEVFGWATIVAIGSVGARHALSPYPDGAWGVLLSNLVLVPLLVAAALGLCGKDWVRWVLIVAIPIGATLLTAKLTLGTTEPFTGRFYALLNLAQAVYLSLWYLVQRLDGESRLCPDPSAYGS
jgi:hypothetical protein